ncbi:MAG: hypothetical protein ACXWFY_00550 [Chthoniobacterales bacterium]
MNRFSRGETLQIEYTDAPTTENETASLAQNTEGKLETAEGKASDLVAVMLSVIPGLGHVYKGYRLLGLLFLIGGGFALLCGGLAATATAGFGLALIPIYWFGVMFHVYAIPDRVASDVSDEGEEY